MNDTIQQIKLASYAIVAPMFAYLGITQELFWIACTMIMIDVATGSIRDWVLKSFKSRELTKGMVSKGILMVIPFILGLASKVAMGIDPTVLINLTLGVFILAEAYSSVANIMQTYTSDKKVSEQDAITMLLQRILSIISGALNSVMTKK